MVQRENRLTQSIQRAIWLKINVLDLLALEIGHVSQNVLYHRLCWFINMLSWDVI